ncbi:UNVERIFIED_CONTAM: hypothetical protein FKN15_057497 [Acipenser sinensis]
MVAAVVGAPTTLEMEIIEELIKRINRNTAAQKEQTTRLERELRESGWAPLERREREPTELELMLQKGAGRRGTAVGSPGERSPGVTCTRGADARRTGGRDRPGARGGEDRTSITAPAHNPRRGSGAGQCGPLLLDTLPVFLDLPALDLEPRSLQHWPQLCPWFPAPLFSSTQMSLGCCQMSLLLPLLPASLPLGDRSSLRWFPGKDFCLLLHPPVLQPTLRSALSARWGPVSPVRGPFLEAPEGPTHPQARPWKRAKIDIC